jgi:hypothetical protein
MTSELLAGQEALSEVRCKAWARVRASQREQVTLQFWGRLAGLGGTLRRIRAEVERQTIEEYDGAEHGVEMEGHVD